MRMLASCVLLVFGCANDAVPTTAAVLCATDGACPGDAVCRADRCLVACTSDASCGVGICVDAACYAASAGACEGDCAPGYECRASQCLELPAIETCSGDGDCSAGGCVSGECRADPHSPDYYYWSFEEDDGGWTTAEDLTSEFHPAGISWAWGTPSKPFVPAAAFGTRAWVSGLTGDTILNESSYLISPVLDFSGATTDPVLDLYYIFQMSFAMFEYSIDGGTTWLHLLTSGSTLGNRPNGLFDGRSGEAGVWHRAQHVLPVAGEPDVRIRFLLHDDYGRTAPGFGLDEVHLRSGAVEP